MADQAHLSAIASAVVSHDGYQFDPSSVQWVLSRNVTLSLTWTHGLLSLPLKESLVRILKHYATLYSADHTNNINDRFRAFVYQTTNKTCELEKVTSADLISYRSFLDKDHEWYLGVLSGFLKTWVGMGIPGVDHDVAALFDGWRLKGNRKGAAVQLKCPYEGALSDLEYEALDQKLIDSFELNEIDLDDFVLVTLIKATGRRPVQIGDLKGLDFLEVMSSDGLRESVINIPRRKQRNSGWRTSYKPVSLISEIAYVVSGLIAQNRLRLKELVGNIPDEARDELALFPDWDEVSDVANTAPDEFISLLKTDAFHLKTTTLSQRFKSTVDCLGVLSERTGNQINIFPTRMRRTLGTRAAREGYGSIVIAELLDHSDDQNSRVYTENVPEHVDAINEAVGRQLAPLAQAFAGVLIDKEFDASRGDDRSSRVRVESGKGAGTCGHFGFCGAYAPIACYTCRHFQPWLDGAHEEVLAGLIAERQRIVNITRDHAIASINDRTIYAVTEVIQRCEARRSELAGGKILG